MVTRLLKASSSPIRHQWKVPIVVFSVLFLFLTKEASNRSRYIQGKCARISNLFSLLFWLQESCLTCFRIRNQNVPCQYVSLFAKWSKHSNYPLVLFSKALLYKYIFNLYKIRQILLLLLFIKVLFASISYILLYFIKMIYFQFFISGSYQKIRLKYIVFVIFRK